jgi:flagellar basal body L-ring protein FlgH
MVDDVLPNGNLVVKGVRKRTYGGETQFVVFSGIARYWDVAGDNTVSSNLIHNAEVEYINERVIQRCRGYTQHIGLS